MAEIYSAHMGGVLRLKQKDVETWNAHMAKMDIILDANKHSTGRPFFAAYARIVGAE